MQRTKIVEEGRVYASADYGDGVVVVEKVDPTFVHTAPTSISAGSEITVTFTMRDFDGAQRSESGGALHLDVAGTLLALPTENGRASMQMEVHASVTIEQRAPYFCDARMTPFTIEVTA